jgi:diguanylate cyclase (GGDEF)-like protein/PAS domain S-box-containing protein
MAETTTAVRVWTDDELTEAFGTVDAVFARDGSARTVPVPPALAARPAGDGRSTWADQVSYLHPDDRIAAVKLWWEATQQPGVLRRTELRSRSGNRWRRIELSALNLLHQPGARAVVLGTEDLGPAEVVGVHAAPARHQTRSWSFQEVDPVGTVLRCDGDTVGLFGRSADEMVGRSIVEMLHPDDREAAVTMWIEVMSTPGSARVMEMRTAPTEGVERWVESTVTHRLDGPQQAMVVMCLDVSERHAQEAALRASQEEFRTLAEEAPIAVFRTDRDGRVDFANGRWFELTSSVGVVEFLVDLIAAEQRVDWRERWALFSSAEGAETVTFVHPTPDHRRVLSIHCRRVHALGSEPRFVGVLSDVTDETQLRHRADHDSLTGLLNREAFDGVLREALRTHAEAVLAFVDLDGFKLINDALGHEAGDHVLAEVGSRLTSCVRPGDAVARYGGDEFVVLCCGLGEAGEDLLRERIIDALSPPVEGDGIEWPLHASIGCVRADDEDDVVTIIRRADHQMYDNKRTRRRD